MQFELLTTDAVARRGRMTFARGTVETPAFMPVGTYGSVKAMTPRDLADVGAEIILGNTFHLYLRPGLDVIASGGVGSVDDVLALARTGAVGAILGTSIYTGAVDLALAIVQVAALDAEGSPSAC
jgi:imidazole glycerol phosphate synthase subunit HisF